MSSASINELVRDVQEALTDDLRKPEYRGEHKLAGHCYVASEALWHLLGGMCSDYRPVRGRDDQGICHWWLEDSAGEILDPTAQQYTDQGRTPPYDNGRKGGFLTREPSKRAEIVLEKVQKKTRQG